MTDRISEGTPLDISSDLALLALKAALQIDAIKRRTAVDASYVSTLVAQLTDLSRTESVESQLRELAPPMIETVTRAVEAFSGRLPNTYPELARDFQIVLDRTTELSRPRDQMNEPILDSLMSFCFALHSELLAQEEFVDLARRPKSEFRI